MTLFIFGAVLWFCASRSPNTTLEGLLGLDGDLKLELPAGNDGIYVEMEQPDVLAYPHPPY